MDTSITAVIVFKKVDYKGKPRLYIELNPQPPVSIRRMFGFDINLEETSKDLEEAIDAMIDHAVSAKKIEQWKNEDKTPFNLALKFEYNLKDYSTGVLVVDDKPKHERLIGNTTHYFPLTPDEIIFIKRAISNILKNDKE